MIDILFRGKRADKNEWVYGLLFKEYSQFYGKFYWAIQRLNKFGITIATYEIIPETVGRCTGLADKNYNKIFKGDILNVGIGKRLMYVHFNGETLAWELTDVGVSACEVNHLDNTFELGEIQVESCYGEMFSEVIGNIHDNPELLEVQA